MGQAGQDSGLSQVKVKGRAVTASNAGWVDQFLLLEKVGQTSPFGPPELQIRVVVKDRALSKSIMPIRALHVLLATAPCLIQDTGQAEYHPQIT